MRINILTIGALGVAGLVTTGLMALPITAQAMDGKDQVIKRDDDTPDIVLVADDDDDDDGARAHGTHTNTHTGTHGNNHTNTNTGTRSGRDHSHGGPRVDHTNDGPGKGNVDHSRNHTNDGTRHNTRG
jgi:hypothetical protein